MSILDRIKERFSPVKALPEGVYHLQSPIEENKPFRLHLRLHKNGTGILILNAATVMHLNPTAAEFAYHLIKGSEPLAAAKTISARYRIKISQALEDYADFVERILNLARTTDLDPVSVLNFERVPPNSADLTAPLRLDCALTYRLPDGGDPLNAPLKRVDRELSTAEWKAVIDTAWANGIPHIVFTGGEATLREDLPELISCAEKNGQVTGLLTDGMKLADDAYLDILLKTGLDHLMIVLPTNADPDWPAIQNAVKADIFLAVHFTLSPHNVTGSQALMDKLSQAGVQAVSLSMSDMTLQQQLSNLQDHVAGINMRLVSDLPVPYSAAHPVALETAQDHESDGAGKTRLYIEPDGDVLPSQGLSDQIMGNIIRDPWHKISNT